VEKRRQFYARAVSIFLHVSDVYRAIRSKDVKVVRFLLDQLEVKAADWDSRIRALDDLFDTYTAYRIEHAAWRHGGMVGDEPQEPNWNLDFPSDEEAQRFVNVLGNLFTGIRTLDKTTGLFDDDIFSIGRLVADVADKLGALADLVNSKDDGLIDRNQLAVLTGIDAKTLKNNPQWLPDPVKRGKKGVPIYRYSEVMARLELKRPELPKLPAYSEGMAKIVAKVSSTGHLPATAPSVSRNRPGTVP